MDSNTDISKLFTEMYHDGRVLEVKFTKANGDERTMVVERDKTMEENVLGTRNFKNEAVKRVVEVLSDGMKQWRSVPLNRLISVRAIDA